MRSSTFGVKWCEIQQETGLIVVAEEILRGYTLRGSRRYCVSVCCVIVCDVFLFVYFLYCSDSRGSPCVHFTGWSRFCVEYRPDAFLCYLGGCAPHQPVLYTVLLDRARFHQKGRKYEGVEHLSKKHKSFLGRY